MPRFVGAVADSGRRLWGLDYVLPQRRLDVETLDGINSNYGASCVKTPKAALTWLKSRAVHMAAIWLRNKHSNWVGERNSAALHTHIHTQRTPVQLRGPSATSVSGRV